MFTCLLDCKKFLLYFQKKDSHIKPIPAFRPIPADNATPEPSPEKQSSGVAKERGRSRGERKAKQASSNNSSASEIQLSEQGFQSDSSTSTISDNSVTTMNCKNKKSDFVVLLDSTAVSAAKVSSTCVKEISAAEGSVNASEKQKKKIKDTLTTDSSEKKDDCINLEKITPISSASVFDFEDNDTNGSSKNPDSKFDKKRGTDNTDEPEKKKSKHSRCLISPYYESDSND